jgi:predicted acyl esterase
MDLFVALRVLDERGKPLRFVGEDTTKAPVAQGWLRVSHRKTDARLSKPYRPWHTHDEKQPLKPGDIVPVDVEIWPTSFVLQKGYRLQVEIRPHDPRGIGDIRHLSPIGRGHNTIYTGGNRASYLLLPVVQEK